MRSLTRGAGTTSAVGTAAAAALAVLVSTALMTAFTAASTAQAAGATSLLKTARAAAGQCGTAQLGLSFTGSSAGAGQRFLTLVFTNQSHSACSANGYPRLQFYGKYGHAIATIQSNSGPHGAVLVPPGGKARSCLRWGAISPPFVHPYVIGVKPPGAAAALFVPWKWGAVYRGDVTVTGLQAGTTCP